MATPERPTGVGLEHADAAATLAPAGALQEPGRDVGRGHVPGLVSPHPLIELLPALLQDDDVTRRWVAGLDDVLAPIHSTLDNLEAYVDPRTAPEDWLSWLSQWVGLPPAADLDARHRRRAVASAGDLLALRGTAQGLRDLVAATLDCTVEVDDNGGATWSAAPGGELPGSADAWVRVRVVEVPDGVEISAATLQAIVADAVPAHARVELDLGPAAAHVPPAKQKETP